MKTREQAEARALELYPIHPEFDVDRLKPLREAFLAGVEWEKERTELTNGKSYENLDAKGIEHSELPSEKKKEHLKEMMRKDEASKTIKEAFENIPKEVRDRHAKAAYNEHKQLREAAEKVVKKSAWYDLEHISIDFANAVVELEKTLK